MALIGNHDRIDEALEMLSGCGPETVEGFSNHGPMAAEALGAMGRSDVVIAWVDRYRKHATPRPVAAGRIDSSQWRTALGDYRCFPQWAEFFGEELKNASWRDVLDRWAARLAPGITAAAFHGALRTAHAARSLGDADTSLRRAELAQGLGYWAASYQPLNPKTAATHGAPASRALTGVPLLPDNQRRTSGAITDALAPVTAYPAFADVYGMLDASGEVGALISDLTATFAQVFDANATGIVPVIAFIHCVTGPSCVRIMMPHISEATARACAAHAWHAAAAIYSTYAAKPWRAAADQESEAERPMTVEKLIDRSVRNGNEHAIKFTEACIRESAPRPHPAYARAASHAIARLPPSR